MDLKLSINGGRAEKYLSIISRICEKHYHNSKIRFNCSKRTQVKFYLGGLREFHNIAINRDTIIQCIDDIAKITKPFLYELPYANVIPSRIHGVVVHLMLDDKTSSKLNELHGVLYRGELAKHKYIEEDLLIPIFSVVVSWVNCNELNPEPAQKLADEINELPFGISGQAESILLEEVINGKWETIHTFPLGGGA